MVTLPAELQRVGLISPAWPADTASNGIATYVANLRIGLDAAGLESTVIANQVEPTRGRADDTPGVIDAGRFLPPWPLKGVWKTHEQFAGVDTTARRIAFRVSAALRAAHARAPLDLFEMEESLGAAHFVADSIARPMIVRLHGPWCVVAPALGFPDDRTFRRRVALERRAICGADAVSSPSRYALASVRRHYGLGLPDAQVIPNPIAIQPVNRRWRYEACDKKTVLFVGRFDRLKGGDVVLAAFRRLASEVREAQLLFVGPDRGLRDGTGKIWTFDEYVRTHLPEEASGRIKMLGEQPASAIAELRRSSFLTLVASRFETFSMTAVEALSYGSPLVAPAAAAIVEIVEHGRNGLLFAEADPEDSARQLISLFRDPELARRLANAGVEDAAIRFSPEVIGRKMRTFYQDVCRGGPAGLTLGRRARRSFRTLWPY
jgi:glycosyltransferase involved in cell wall biosynthesis